MSGSDSPLASKPHPSQPSSSNSQDQQKRSQQKDQGWSFVKPRKGCYHKCASSTPPTIPQARSGPLRSAKDITDEYHRLRQDFCSNPCHQSIKKLITGSADSSCPVTEAICLGIGTFDPADGGWEAKRRTYIQLFALEAIIEELEIITNSKIKCTFQEPLFTEADATFLRSLGHRVVEAPLASEAVTSDTLLYGIHLYRNLYAEALRSHLPAMFVGTGWATWDGITVLSIEDLHGLRTMDETYRRWDFPQEGNCFSSTCLYWRRGEEAYHGNGKAVDVEETCVSTRSLVKAQPGAGGGKHRNRVG